MFSKKHSKLYFIVNTDQFKQAISETKIQNKHLSIGFSTKWLSFMGFPQQKTYFGIKKTWGR